MFFSLNAASTTAAATDAAKNAVSANTVWQYVLGSILLVLAIALIVIVLQQSGKERGLSGTIGGGADTYFGKSGGNTKEKLLTKLTIIGSALFVVCAIALTILVLVA